MARPARRRFSRSASIAAALLLAAIYVANLPYYCGSSLGERFSWRMEHGRLMLESSQVGSTESFYVAFNTEGLRFAFDGKYWDAGDWKVTVPLWAPLLLCAGWVAWAWQPKRKAPEA